MKTFLASQFGVGRHRQRVSASRAEDAGVIAEASGDVQSVQCKRPSVKRLAHYATSKTLSVCAGMIVKRAARRARVVINAIRIDMKRV